MRGICSGGIVGRESGFLWRTEDWAMEKAIESYAAQLLAEATNMPLRLIEALADDDGFCFTKQEALSAVMLALARKPPTEGG